MYKKFFYYLINTYKYKKYNLQEMVLLHYQTLINK